MEWKRDSEWIRSCWKDSTNWRKENGDCLLREREEEENTSLQDDLIKIDKEDNKKTNDVHSLQIVLTIHNNSFL